MILNPKNLMNWGASTDNLPFNLNKNWSDLWHSSRAASSWQGPRQTCSLACTSVWTFQETQGGSHATFQRTWKFRQYPCYLREHLLSSSHITSGSTCKSEQVKASFCRQVTEHINCNFNGTVEISKCMTFMYSSNQTGAYWLLDWVFSSQQGYF